MPETPIIMNPQAKRKQKNIESNIREILSTTE